jgi:DNA-directed RNA polymerase specialized sigma24 family protein
MPANARDKARAGAERAQRDYERDLDKARVARRRSFEQAQKAGLSLREIGDAVGLHHSSVAEIIRGE